MAAVQRMGDANDGGGTINSIPQSTVYVDSLLVCVDGSLGTSHDPCPLIVIHCAGNWVTSGGVSTVTAEGIPINVTGNSDTCGHSRIGGSSDVNIG